MVELGINMSEIASMRKKIREMSISLAKRRSWRRVGEQDDLRKEFLKELKKHRGQKHKFDDEWSVNLV